MADWKNKEVKKHIGAIHISGKLSFLQRKIANILLWNAYEDLLKQENHRIRIRDVALLVGFDSNDREVLKDALRGLADTRLEWDLLHEDGEKEWGVASMLSQAVIRGGYCSYAYSPAMREKFYNPEIYARINIGIQRKITSGYALALYENCVRYRKVGSTGWMDLFTFKKLLGVEDSKYYQVFKHLNNKIIKPSVSNVNSTSDIILSVEFQRQKRRVSAVKFTVTENPQISLFSRKAPEIKLLNGEQLEKEESNIIGRLQDFGISRQKAEKYAQEYPEDYLHGNLDAVEKDYLAGKVKRLPAYTTSAIKEDYRPKQSPYETNFSRRKQEAKEQANQILLAIERLNALKNEFKSHQLQQELKNLSEEDREKLRERFLESKKEDRFFQRWMKEGFEHRVVQSLFRAFVAKELLTEDTQEEDFEKFVCEQGEDLAILRRTASMVPAKGSVTQTLAM